MCCQGLNEELLNNFSNQDSLRAKLIGLYNNLGLTHKDLGNLEEGAFFLRKAISLEHFFPDKWREGLRAKINLVDILVATNHLDEAQEVLSSMDSVFEYRSDPSLQFFTYYSKGNLAAARGALNQAASYFETGLAMVQEIDESLSISYFARRMADLYKEMGASDKVVRMLELAEEAEQKVDKPGAMLSLQEFEIQKQFDDWEKEINSLHQRKTTQLFLLALALLLLTILFLVLFFLTHKKHRIVQLEKINMELSLKSAELEKNMLASQVENNNKKLFTETVYRLQRNSWIQNEIGNLLTVYRSSNSLNRKTIQKVIAVMKREVEEDAWEDFEVRFQNVHLDFMERLQQAFPNLTKNERRLSAFLKLDMTIKEIAMISGQSEKALHMASYRLRKKLNLPQEESLIAFIQTIQIWSFGSMLIIKL